MFNGILLLNGNFKLSFENKFKETLKITFSIDKMFENTKYRYN